MEENTLPEVTVLSEEEIIDEAAMEEESESTTSTTSEASDSFTAASKPNTSEKAQKADTHSEDPQNSRHFFRFRKEDMDFSRDKWILSRIRDEDLMDYLKLEQERNEQLQHAKEVRGKRLMAAFQLTISLAALVTVVYLLKDTPTILVNILYICGIIAALWLWKNPREKK